MIERRAFQGLGGAGYTREYPLEHLFRDQRLNMIHEGAEAIHGIDLLGRKLAAVREQINVRPVVNNDTIRGEVIHVDHYGNVITNITKEAFTSVVKHQAFKIAFGASRHDITAIHKTYSDVPVGERVAFFGDSGLLEMAVNKGAVGNGGGAAQLLGLRVTDPVLLELAAVPAKTVAHA